MLLILNCSGSQRRVVHLNQSLESAWSVGCLLVNVCCPGPAALSWSSTCVHFHSCCTLLGAVQGLPQWRVWWQLLSTILCSLSHYKIQLKISSPDHSKYLMNRIAQWYLIISAQCMFNFLILILYFTHHYNRASKIKRSKILWAKTSRKMGLRKGLSIPSLVWKTDFF